MKVLHLDSGIVFRGGQRQSLTLHDGLIKRGVSSFLLCDKKSEAYSISEKNGLKNIIGKKINFFSLLSYCHKIKPDIVHFHDSNSLKSFIPYMKPPFKTVETRRVAYPISFLSRFYKYSKIDAHVGVSIEIKDYLLKYFKNVYTINSCIELNRFDKKFKNNPYPISNSKDILFVGAFSKQKGIDVLIKSFKRICNDISNLALHLVGTGDLYGDIEKEAMISGISDKIFFYGFKNNVEDFYHFCDLVVVPSVDGEGSSGVIKEGMAAGKIVLASDLEANKEIIEDNINGLIFKAGSDTTLYKKLYDVLSGCHKLDIGKILNRAKDFGCNEMVEKYLSLYEKLLG